MRLVGVYNLDDHLMSEIALSEVAVAKTALTLANSTVLQRIKALKGMTLASGQPDAMPDAFLRHVLIEGGLDPEKEVSRSQWIRRQSIRQ